MNKGHSKMVNVDFKQMARSRYIVIDKIIKVPKTSFQSTALRQKSVRNISHTEHISILKNFISIALRIQRK